MTLQEMVVRYFAGYPNTKPTNLEETYERYHDELKDLPLHEVSRAMKHDGDKPLPAMVIHLRVVEALLGLPSAPEAWLQVNTPEDYGGWASLHPCVRWAGKAVGGRTTIRQASDRERINIEFSFKQAYTAAAQKAVDRACDEQGVLPALLAGEQGWDKLFGASPDPSMPALEPGPREETRDDGELGKLEWQKIKQQMYDAGLINEKRLNSEAPRFDNESKKPPKPGPDDPFPPPNQWTDESGIRRDVHGDPLTLPDVVYEPVLDENGKRLGWRFPEGERR